MSKAYQCDVCTRLYIDSDEAVRLDVSRNNGDGYDDQNTWSDVDLCPSCAAKVIAIIKPALLEWPE